MSGFEVLNGGTYSCIQDLGRYGYAHLGVTSSGAMDEYAYRWGQKLLGNKKANAIEVLLGGLRLKSLVDTTISACGADLDFRINNEKQNIWQTHQIRTGDILGFYGHVNGLRAYLAVKGGFDVEKVEESYATTQREDKGLVLKKGRFLLCQTLSQTNVQRVPTKYRESYSKTLTLRILLNRQYNAESQETLLNSNYALTSQINAMGYKLQGDAIPNSEDGIISEGIPFGTVQVPPDGQPIILLKERQTIGGYPKIGTVLAKDCFALAQLPIGAKVNFKVISIEEAQQKMKAFYRFFS